MGKTERKNLLQLLHWSKGKLFKTGHNMFFAPSAPMEQEKTFQNHVHFAPVCSRPAPSAEWSRFFRFSASKTELFILCSKCSTLLYNNVKHTYIGKLYTRARVVLPSYRERGWSDWSKWSRGLAGGAA